MLKEILQRLVRRKNPHFRWDDSITTGQILSLAWTKGLAWLRAWRLLLYGRVPRMLFLGRGVRFFNLANIHFGRWVQLEDHVFVSALSRQPVMFGDNVRIGAFSRIVAATSFDHVGSYIRIGNNVGIGEFAYLGGGGGLEIRLQGVTRKGIRIGRNCWIGSKVTILDGVTIGDNCVIAAGAVVTKSMPSDSVIGGVPARVLKHIAPDDQDTMPPPVEEVPAAASG